VVTNRYKHHTAHKRESNAFLLHLHNRLLKEAQKTSPINNKLKFSQTHYILGAVHRIPREMHFSFLQQMQHAGLVEIRPYHYVILIRSESK